MVGRFDRDGFVAACGETTIVLTNLFERNAVAVRAFVPLLPLGQQVGNVVGCDRYSLIVEAVPIGGQVIEPDALGLRPFSKIKAAVLTPEYGLNTPEGMLTTACKSHSVSNNSRTLRAALLQPAQ